MKRLFMATLLALFAMGSTAFAEGTSQLGVGAGVTDNSARIRVPIVLDATSRLEPEFEVLFSSSDDVDRTNLVFAAGYHLLQKVDTSVSTYYGVKAGISHNDVSFDNGGDTDETNLFVGPVGGFEYYLAPKVTLGAEVGAFLGFGDTTSLSTQANVLLRYYF